MKRLPLQDDRDPVERIAEEFLADIRRGKSVSVDKFVDRHPEHAEEIKTLFPTLLMMEDIKPEGQEGVGVVRDSDPLLGRHLVRLGDYRIIRRIGYGGMGVVYEAEQESLGRRVAMKVLSPSLLRTGKHIRRFERESRAAAQLHHSNIVPVLGVGEHWGVNYYIMQLIDGKGIDKWLAMDSEPTGLRNDFTRIARIGVQIASALEYAHSMGILHRDIKPANILLDKDETAWLADFGLATLENEDGVTATGNTIGTLRYMSPERLRGESDQRSDVYGLGLTLFELATWQPAFGGSTNVVQDIHSGRVPRLSLLNTKIPRDLETIILKATATAPERRYQSAGELQKDLDLFLDDRPIVARRASLPERVWRWARRSPALAAACFAVLMLLTTVAVVSLAGYFQVQSALLEKERQEGKTQAVSQLATQAIDSMFERFAPQSVDSLEQDNLQDPVLSRDVAELLEDLLVFYGDLASQQPSRNGDQLDRKAAEAVIKVAKIRKILGEYDKSIAAFRDGLEKLDKLAARDGNYGSSAAKIHNEIGRVYRLIGDDAGFRQEHEWVVASVAADASEEESLFELARAHYYLVQRIRPGLTADDLPPKLAANGDSQLSALPPTDDDHLSDAIAILQRLTKDDPPPKFRHLLGLSYAESATDRLDQRNENDLGNLQLAVDELQKLSEEFPGVSEYRFDLMQVLGRVVVFGEALDGVDLEATQANLQRAILLGEQLVDSQPGAPLYLTALSHNYYKYGMVTSKSLQPGPPRPQGPPGGPGPPGLAENTQADKAFSRAVALQQKLVERYPEAYGYRAWLGLFQLDQSRRLTHPLQRGEAQQSLVVCIRNLEQTKTLAETQGVAGDSIDVLEQLLDSAYEELARRLGPFGRHLLDGAE